MKTLVLFVSLSVLSQPAFCGQFVSTWQRVSRSLWTAPATIIGGTVVASTTHALVGGEAAIGVAALGLAYFGYTFLVTEGRRLRTDDIGLQIIYQEGDGLSKATVGVIDYDDGHDFSTATGEILSTTDIVAYELLDHDDLGRKVLLPANNDNGHIEGRVERVFTHGFYEVVGTSDPTTLVVHAKNNGLKFVE